MKEFFISLHADIDECGLDTDQCSQSCHNNVGSYNCSCETGNYRLNVDGHQCDGGSGSDGEGRTGVERERGRGLNLLASDLSAKIIPFYRH